MITPIEINRILFEIVNGSALKNAISGKVYRDRRPVNASKEDVVTNVVVVSGSLSIIQDAAVNINIHVPSINAGDGPMPNSKRFEQLSAIAGPILKYGAGTHFTYYTENIQLLKEQDKEEWFLNFRLRFTQHNNIANN